MAHPEFVKKCGARTVSFRLRKNFSGWTRRGLAYDFFFSHATFKRLVRQSAWEAQVLLRARVFAKDGEVFSRTAGRGGGGGRPVAGGIYAHS